MRGEVDILRAREDAWGSFLGMNSSRLAAHLLVLQARSQEVAVGSGGADREGTRSIRNSDGAKRLVRIDIRMTWL